jgi:DNA polymerase-3 subunit epsilon
VHESSAAPPWLARLPKTKVAFVDVETTGLHRSDRIVSLAVIVLNIPPLASAQFRVGFTHLIFDPGKKCHPVAARIHGDDDWTLRHQPFFADHAKEVHDLLDAAELLVAHNAAFDMGFINREFAAEGLGPISIRAFCTMQAYRQRFQGRVNLEAVAHRAGMARTGRQHGAMEDAWLTMNVFLWLHGCPSRAPFSLMSEEQRAFRNFCPVPPMPEGDLPRRKRRTSVKSGTPLPSSRAGVVSVRAVDR